MDVEEEELVCNACGCFSEIDTTTGNMRFMNDGRIVSAPEEERLAYEQAKSEWPDIYAKFEEKEKENIIYFKVPKEFLAKS